MRTPAKALIFNAICQNGVFLECSTPLKAAPLIQRYFVPSLAHASYLVGAGGEAAIVDPKRDVDNYMDDAKRLGLRITAILETHPHADFVSGHLELARRTGAVIYISRRAAAQFAHRGVAEGDVIRLGAVELVALETPGHSPDSVSWLLRHHGLPVAVFTGDTLFVGDVGRPDLRDAEESPAKLARALYDSLFKRLLKLPDDTRVYPAHGAGSLCGRSPGAAPFTTIGQERVGNWALQLTDRAKFVRQMTKDLPARPAYFSHVVQMNLRGAAPLGDLPRLRLISRNAAQKAAQAGATLIDLRPPELFGAGHLPGSLNIGIDGHLFSTWTGFFAPFGRPVALIAAAKADAAAARLELARIGYDDILGWVKAQTLRGTETLEQLSARDLRKELHGPHPPLVLDVRTDSEWQAGHIAEARHIPLPTLLHRCGELSCGDTLAVICGSGYRSSVAASLLRRQGFSHLRNVSGGMTAFEETKL